MPFSRDPALVDLALGQHIDVVVQATGHDHMYKGLLHGDVFHCFGLGPGIWTLLSYQVSSISDGLVCLTNTAQSSAISKTALDGDALLRLRDLCAGVGGLTVGTSFAGCRTILAADHSPIACETLLLNQLPAMQGDISSPEVQRAIVRDNPGLASILSASIPGSPYLGPTVDKCICPETHVLSHVLSIAWLLQSDCMILECTPALAKRREAVDELNAFANARGLRIPQFCLT